MKKNEEQLRTMANNVNMFYMEWRTDSQVRSRTMKNKKEMILMSWISSK